MQSDRFCAFCLRGNTWLTLDDGRRRYAATFNERMPRNTTRYYPQTTLYNGLTLHLVCHRPARGERILLITNRTDRQTGAGRLWTALGY